MSTSCNSKGLLSLPSAEGTLHQRMSRSSLASRGSLETQQFQHFEELTFLGLLWTHALGSIDSWESACVMALASEHGNEGKSHRDPPQVTCRPSREACKKNSLWKVSRDEARAPGFISGRLHTEDVPGVSAWVALFPSWCSPRSSFPALLPFPYCCSHSTPSAPEIHLRGFRTPSLEPRAASPGAVIGF